MGSETSREFDSSTHSSENPGDAIDVAAYEAEVNKMREINRMDRTIRSRLQQGVKYNMRVLICGDKGTGKTLLWRRFQGQAFDPESATIDWTSPSASAENNIVTLRSIHSDDTVKVDVWDVVDKAIHTQQNALNRHSTADLVYSLNKAGEPELSFGVAEGKHALKLMDSSVVDIYKDAHAVIFMLNPHSEKSLQYVRDKYPLVPDHISVLLVLNFRDKLKATSGGHSPTQPPPSPTQAVTLAQVRALAEEIRSYRSNQQCNDVTVLETSLLDCYGLLHLHHYLDVPFLRLKHKSLQDQLALVDGDLHTCHAHLNDTVRLSNYDEYLRHYEARRRERQLLQQQSSHGFPQGPPPDPNSRATGVNNRAASGHPQVAAVCTSAQSVAAAHDITAHSSAPTAVAPAPAPAPAPVAPAPPSRQTPAAAHPVILHHNNATAASHTAAAEVNSSNGVDPSNRGSSALSAVDTQAKDGPRSPLNSSTNTNFSDTSDTSDTAYAADSSTTYSTPGAITTGSTGGAGSASDKAHEENTDGGASTAGAEAGPEGQLDGVLAIEGVTSSVLDGFLEMDSDTDDQDQQAGMQVPRAQVPLSVPISTEDTRPQQSHSAAQDATTSRVSPPNGNGPAVRISRASRASRTSRSSRSTALSESDDSDSDEGVGNAKLAQKVGFGGKSLSSVWENKQRGGLVRPLRKAKATANTNNGSVVVEQGIEEDTGIVIAETDL